MESTQATQTNETQRKVDQMLTRYAESHRHPKNEMIHFICVPVIMWTVPVSYTHLTLPTKRIV